MSSTTTGSRLLDAIIAGNHEEAKHLISIGVDVNTKREKGVTPLIAASIAKMNSIIIPLIHKGADVNAQDDDGNTAFMHACRVGNESAADILIRHGSDIFRPTGPFGRTPLIAAASAGLTSVVETILQRLKNDPKKLEYLNTRDNSGKTAVDVSQIKLNQASSAELAEKYKNIVSMINDAMTTAGGKRKRSRRQKQKSRKSRKTRRAYRGASSIRSVHNS